MNIMKREDIWDRTGVLADFRQELDKLFGRSVLKHNGWKTSFEPEVDVVEEKDNVVVKADLPGVKKEELEVKVEGRLLTLKGERKEEKETKEKNYYASERFYGAFTRMIELPTDIKAEQVKAVCKDGVLTVTLPKTEGAKAKQVAVEVQ
ncbi:MAG: hypothetical protein A2Y02_02605 [Omnitrophica bacterium GWA2_52_12]|nr:MAG: hypothetical protein A2Y02_02605 [Omnitrophica bacterium GWA2_52_12]